MRVEYCIYRTGENSEENSSTSFAIRPLVETTMSRKCLILIEKGIPDTTCYNPDMGTFSCPIAKKDTKEGYLDS